MKTPRSIPRLLGCASIGLILAVAGVGCGDDEMPPGTTTGGAGGSSGTGGMAPGAGGTGGAPVMPGACKNEMKVISGDITTSTTWECNSYVLKGKTHILNGATLTIAAGSKVFGDGDTGNPAALISTREGKLVAVGTAENPIVFGSINPPGMRMPGDTFAGVALMGKATINSGRCVNDADPATPACDAPGFFENSIEGIPPTDPRGAYGGTDDAYNCGELKYVRVEFAGFVIGADNELNGITVGACGSGTKLSYIQVHRGFDDGIEFFGGTASVDHLVISAPTDDGLDFDEGWRGTAQFVVIHQGYGVGDKGIEGDNFGGKEDATPRSKPNLWNFSMIGRPGAMGSVAMHLREGAFASVRNFIVTDFGGGAVDIDAKQVMIGTEWPANLSIENSVFFGGPLAKDEAAMDNDMGFDEAAALMSADRKNQINMDAMMASKDIKTPGYIPGNAAVANQAAPGASVAGIVDTAATFAGAVKPGEATPWYAGWTVFPEN
jgi:hypothetical protein